MIRETKKARAARIAEHLMYIFIDPRLTGSEQSKRASRYMVNQIREIEEEAVIRFRGKRYE